MVSIRKHLQKIADRFRLISISHPARIYIHMSINLKLHALRTSSIKFKLSTFYRALLCTSF
ncbi:MAG: hypothetical protein QXQ29_01290 [Candidatus Bathyarchaeia archaeon]